MAQRLKGRKPHIAGLEILPAIHSLNGLQDDACQTGNGIGMANPSQRRYVLGAAPYARLAHAIELVDQRTRDVIDQDGINMLHP